MSESVLNFLEEKNLPEVTKKKHTYLDYIKIVRV